DDAATVAAARLVDLSHAAFTEPVEQDVAAAQEVGAATLRDLLGLKRRQQLLAEQGTDERTDAVGRQGTHDLVQPGRLDEALQNALRVGVAQPLLSVGETRCRLF